MFLLKYFFGRIFVRIFTPLARYRLARIAALILPLYMRKLKNADVLDHPIRTLIIPKENFVEDVFSSLGPNGWFDIYSVYRRVFKTMAEGILHPSLDDNNYSSNDPEVESSKRAYRDFLIDLWAKLEYFYKFDVVLTANFAYFAERELAAALETRGIPFVVLQKENLKTPGFMDFFAHLYRIRRGPFLGRRIFVYNDIERRLEIDAGVITPNRVTITGMPRLDVIHRWRESQVVNDGEGDSPQVLFFSFWPKTGLPIMARKTRTGIVGGYERLDEDLENLSWSELVKGCHQAMLRLAKESPEIRVVIKAKGRTRESSAMYEMLGEPAHIPPNVEIVEGGDPFHLIARSRVICGFNTTALFEALAAGKPVVMPRFGEALDERMQAYVVNLEDAVEYADSPGDLIDRLRRHALGSGLIETILPQRKVRVLEKWVGNADGMSGHRVREALLNEINHKRPAPLGEQERF
jgi:glycosyltransferase involved in cell wall biosynthesis